MTTSAAAPAASRLHGRHEAARRAGGRLLLPRRLRHLRSGRRTAKHQATVVIEVLSERTEGYDRGAKFAHYRRLETLTEYVLVDSRSRSVEVFSRRDDGWLFQAVPEGGRLRLESLDFACDLDAVYEDVSFEPREDTT